MPQTKPIRNAVLAPVRRAVGRAALGFVPALVLLTAGGCAAPAAERDRVGAFDSAASIADTPFVTLDRPELGSFLEFAAPEVTRSGGELRVVVPVTNAGPYWYAVSAHFFYYNENGEQLERSPARTLRLEPGQSSAFRSVSTAGGAEDWRAHVSWAD